MRFTSVDELLGLESDNFSFANEEYDMFTTMEAFEGMVEASANAAMIGKAIDMRLAHSTENVGEFFGKIGEGIKKIIKWLVNLVVSFMNWLRGIWNNIWNKEKDSKQKLKNAIKEAEESVTQSNIEVSQAENDLGDTKRSVANNMINHHTTMNEILKQSLEQIQKNQEKINTLNKESEEKNKEFERGRRSSEDITKEMDDAIYKLADKFESEAYIVDKMTKEVKSGHIESLEEFGKGGNHEEEFTELMNKINKLDITDKPRRITQENFKEVIDQLINVGGVSDSNRKKTIVTSIDKLRDLHNVLNRLVIDNVIAGNFKYDGKTLSNEQITVFKDAIYKRVEHIRLAIEAFRKLHKSVADNSVRDIRLSYEIADTISRVGKNLMTTTI